MDDLIISTYFLAGLFFCISFLYSSVGLGGGSSYTALLAILGVYPPIIPSISLTLNLVVTFTGAMNFIRKGYLRLSLIVPFLVTSIPMSYLGGLIALPDGVFYIILLTTLVLIAMRIYFWSELSVKCDLSQRGKLIMSLVLGSILGFIAGTMGIGGGIYLVPLIITLQLGSEKEAAAAGAVFIWLNSLAGITAKYQKGLMDISAILPLIGAVLIGGYLGSFLGANKYDPKTMQKILGIIILIAIIFLCRKVVNP